MGHLLARLLVPTLLGALLLPAAEPEPLLELQLGDGARLLQHLDGSIYAKLWNERSMEALRAKVAENLGPIEGRLGFTLRDLVGAIAGGDLRLTGLIAPAVDAAAKAPRARLLAQCDLGAYAARVMELISAANPTAEAVAIAGADSALRPTMAGNPALERVTIARFGNRLVVDANREQAPAPHDLAPIATDLRGTLGYRSLVAAMKQAATDPQQRQALASLAGMDQYMEPVHWELSVVPEGVHERLTQDIAYPGVRPVDRGVFAHLPATTLMALAVGFDSRAYWTAFEPLLLKMLADQGQAMTAAQLGTQLEQGLAGLGLPLSAAQVIDGLQGTLLVAVTSAAPFPGVTIAIPRSPAIDQFLRLGLSTRLQVEPPADGASVLLPIPNLPLPITLVADPGYWVVTSDQAVAAGWHAGGANWATSAAVALALGKANPKAFLIGASDTPAVLRTLGGFLPLMPIQEAKDKQTITVLLARAAGWAATGFVVAQPQDQGWQLEARGLFGFGALPLAAAVASAAFVVPKQAAGEAAVVSQLRSGVFPAQVQFQAGGYLDQNGDNVGEYAFLSELSGGAITGQPESMRLSLLPAGWNAAQPEVNGYRFSCWLPDGKGGALSGNDGPRVPSAAAAKAQSERFVVYAWPDGDAGGTVYALTQSGAIYTSSTVVLTNEGPAWHALFAGAGWDAAPTWELYRKR